MNPSIRLFAKTMSQVAHEVERVAGESAVSPRARAIVAGLALTMAASAPAFAKDPLLTPYKERPAAEEQAEQQGMTERQAGGLGAAVGAIVGTVVTSKGNTASKLVGIFGGAWAGKELGEAIHGPDANSRPTSRAIGSGAIGSGGSYNPGGYSNYSDGGPSNASYRDAVNRSAAAAAGRPNPGLRALDPDMHVAIYRLMIDTAATRAVASQALRDLDKAKLQQSINKRDPEVQARVEAARKLYDMQFRLYEGDYVQLRATLNQATVSKFDVSPQLTLFNSIPADLRIESIGPTNWPGVQERVAQIAGDSYGGRTSLAEHGVLGQQPEAQARRVAYRER